MKKILTLILSACIIAAVACVFSACGDSSLPTNVSLQQDACVLSGEGETFDISKIVEVGPDGASQKVVYTSSNTSVIEVSEDGVATAKGYGVATVTVTSALNDSAKATIDFAVIDYLGSYSGEKFVAAMNCTVSISLTLNADGTFDFCRGPMTVGGEENSEMPDEGTYSLSGAMVDFEGNTFGSFSATISVQSGAAVLNGRFPTGGPTLELTLNKD